MPDRPLGAQGRGMTRNPSSPPRPSTRRPRPRTRRAMLLAAGAAVAASGCQLYATVPPPPRGTTTVAEGAEPNGNEVDAVPTAFSAPFPVRLTGTQDAGNAVDAFTTTAPGPGTLASSCTEGVNVRPTDESLGTSTQGPCGLEFHTDGGAVSLWIIPLDPGEPYAVTITFVPD